MATGTLIPAPSWYDNSLPKFYRQSNGRILLFPLNSNPKYTQDNVLDLLLYYQTIIGVNRIDFQNARSAAWSSGGWTAKIWAEAAFKTNQNGDGSGDWSNIPAGGEDGALYTALQQRYIVLNATQMPWLSALNAIGGGIDLVTIPFATDIEMPRPDWYPAHLPSLFQGMGEPYQRPMGFLTTKCTLRNGKSSGYTPYAITAMDVASLMMYAQPVIAMGPTPYPVNWYVNDDVNGAMAMYFKVSHQFTANHTNSQMQTWGIAGDLMTLPLLDANPFASGFSRALESVVKYAISFFAGKIPGGTKLTTAALTFAAAGGAGITGGEASPAGTFSADVFAAADEIARGLQKQEETKKYLWLGLLAAVAVGYVGYREGYFGKRRPKRKK